ncbi:peptidoglycan-binding domain-containing protein [Ancylobacter sp.]|uniref:peptidoglycan-binding domain-containing protein n=1 Tax=Ancylobacter sp. TaxID=1872567 RepID=UPI003D132B62
MPRSYASDLLVDDIDLVGERAAGRPYRSGRRRSDLFMLILAGGATAAVLFNALALQQGRPGAAGRAAGPASAPAEIRQVENPRPAANPPAVTPAASTPAAPAQPMTLDSLAGTTTPLPPAKPAAPRVAATPAAPAPVAEKASAPAPGLVPPGEVPVSPRIMDIQKALARLGYGPIRIDGVFGAATQEAIERFERDRRLPVTGQMSERVIRELNAVSGFTIR